MAVKNAAQAAVKTVADPNTAYESMADIWKKNRAVCNGERFVKAFDESVDGISFKNLLIPFSPSMSSRQYAFYKAEAELPGITAQFSKTLIGGLLRKQPVIKFPEEYHEQVYDWIMNEFGKDDSSLTSFLDAALWEEIQTSRAWIFVDYPQIDSEANLDKEDLLNYKPFPILYKAESIINWRIGKDNLGKTILTQVIVRGMHESYEENEFHPTFKDRIWVHELDESGEYIIRVFQRRDKASDVPTKFGTQEQKMDQVHFDEIEFYKIFENGSPLKFIPAWPLNGSIDIIQPLLAPIVDKEVALYNKISRRNHLLYGAATYTPWVASDMDDDQFQEIVDAGLGSWLHLRQEDKIGVLDTPTAALADMEKAIAANIEEMAKLGIRMLTPETDQSGIALQIRNATQTAQLGSLNHKVTTIIKNVIAFMIKWRYNIEIKASDIEFTLSADFNPMPIGEPWLRLATDWYQQGLIPRSAWLSLIKHNDMLSADYDDIEGRQEITQDIDILMNSPDRMAQSLDNEEI
jgi:hypothetical protein